MFKKYLHKVKNNILPFVFIGLIVGIVIGKASMFRGVGFINDFLNYADINTYFPDSGQSLFLNHFGPASLTFLLIAMIAFAGIHRIVFGSREKNSRDNGGFSHTLDTFGSLLAIAWLGLIVGIGLPALIFQGYVRFTVFFLNVSYPLVFLVEAMICTALLSSPFLKKVHSMAGGFGPQSLVVRVEGVVLLLLSAVMLTFQENHLDLIDSFTDWVKSFL
jgi:hypothetical protein